MVPGCPSINVVPVVSDARVVSGIGSANLLRLIGRCIVRDDDLEIGKCLVQQRVQRFRQKAFAVEHRNANTNPGTALAHDLHSLGSSKSSTARSRSGQTA
jgi:hypothetical protein